MNASHGTNGPRQEGRAEGPARRGISRRQFVTLAGLGLASLGLAACGGGDKAAEAPVETAPATSAAAPAAATTSRASGVDADYRIVSRSESKPFLYDLTGKEYPLERDDLELMGPFAEGLAFVRWKESDYDEEWKTETNVGYSAGCVDKDGKLALDFSDIIATLPSKPSVIREDALMFNEGLLAFTCEWETEDEHQNTIHHATSFVVDTKGKLQFSLGDNGSVADTDALGKKGTSTSGMCRYGTFFTTVAGTNESNYCIVDKTGKVVVNKKPDGWGLGNWGAPFGDGLYAERSNDDYDVYDFSGNTVLHLNTSEDGFEGYDQAPNVASVSGEGLISVNVTKLNPNKGGRNKDYMGLYDVTNKKWAYGPIGQELLTWTKYDSFNGIFPLRLQKPPTDTVVDESEIPYPDGGYGLLRADGTWALEPGDSRTSEFTQGDFLTEGYMILNDGNGAYQLIHVDESGVELIDDFPSTVIKAGVYTV